MTEASFLFKSGSKQPHSTKGAKLFNPKFSSLDLTMNQKKPRSFLSGAIERTFNTKEIFYLRLRRTASAASPTRPTMARVEGSGMAVTLTLSKEMPWLDPVPVPLSLTQRMEKVALSAMDTAMLGFDRLAAEASEPSVFGVKVSPETVLKPLPVSSSTDQVF
ncbi:MAG: hypothetical protein ACO3NW_10850, partial [Kiritimatiellia bacterium]